ncbi:conserved Plasmodium protein, unknown function [Plasmodium vinckei vinckei]|uniref:Rad4 beta-hairpin domain-containing protein n=1 Tax=Plasmodium vinckei vinckei TaxID=54757 RepID=A0A449BTU7_PLAVN|nr:conserved Plasmodium protein, unknown function [Plasmodium vinckei vinckei]VEV56828.1 conserved Plasmodium protein, unknown function [Plasmodium vinckei vinckei]
MEKKTTRKRQIEEEEEEKENDEELNDIDEELFGKEELKILQNEQNLSDNYDSENKSEDLQYNNLLEFNEGDFIYLEENESHSNNESEINSNPSSSSDVQVVESVTPQAEEKANEKKNAKKSAKKSPKRKTMKKDQDSENKQNEEDVTSYKEMKKKNIEKKIEENKLSVFLLCWLGHIYFLNDLCNNKLIQAMIYSVYVNYKSGRNNILYKDPVYLFLFIKNNFKLILDSTYWVSSDSIIKKNIRGSYIFRVIRAVNRKRGNNILLNLLFISLCRYLNIPSRICITLPNLNNEYIDTKRENEIIKICTNNYYNDITKNIFFNNYLMTKVDDESSDNYQVGEQDVVFVRENLHTYDKNKGKNFKNFKKNNTNLNNIQFQIFSECYSTSFNKWISFFFCYNIYYFNFYNFSKNCNFNQNETKLFHILLPLPQNPEEIKTFKRAKKVASISEFSKSLFINRHKSSTKQDTDQSQSSNGSDSSSSGRNSDEDKQPEVIDLSEVGNKNISNIKETKNEIIIINDVPEDELKTSQKFSQKNTKKKNNNIRENSNKISDHTYKFEEIAMNINKLNEKNCKTYGGFKVLCQNYKGNMYIEHEENKEIINSLSNIGSPDCIKKKNINNLANNINELKHENNKIKNLSNYVNTLKNEPITSYDEIIYDKYEKFVCKENFDNKYIKILINTNMYKYFHNLDNYNLYISINKYGILKDITVRHKLRLPNSASTNCSDNFKRKNYLSKSIVKGDRLCSLIRNSFRNISYKMNQKKNYNEFEKVLDINDDKYLYNLYVKNMIPKEKTHFLKSNYYILKSMLKKNQVIYPNAPVGLFGGENVYLKEHLYNLTKREFLENKIYYISDSEKPLGYEYDSYSKSKVPLYAEFQQKPRSKNVSTTDGVKNADKNLDENANVNNQEQSHQFDYIYSKQEKVQRLKNKLLAHLKPNNIIELNSDDICVYNIQLKYVFKNIKNNIPCKIIYNNNPYFYKKYLKNINKPNPKVLADKMVIKKKDLKLFKSLYLTQKQKQDEFIIDQKSKQIKNMWKVLFKSILYEHENLQVNQQRTRAKKIYKMPQFNPDIDIYFEN